MGMGTIVERVMAQREEALAERDAALARVKDLELANDLRPELERADVIVAGEMHRRAEMIVSLESERDAALGRVAELEAEILGALEIGELKPEHRDGDSYLVWHDGEWKCAHYEDGVGVWVGWWVTGGDNRQPMHPNPVYYLPMPPDLDESKEVGACQS